MHTFARKPNTATQQSVPAKSTLFTRAHQSSSLQRTIGDQSAQHLSQDKAEEPELVAAPETHFVHDFSQIPVHATAPISIQPKLTVNNPKDMYEQEADRVADMVMRMPEPRLQRQNFLKENNEAIQTKPIANQITPLVQKQTESETEVAEEDEEELLQAKEASGIGQAREISAGVELQIQGLRGGGRPLSVSERAFFEPRFGYDFNNVRIHNDSRAANLASSVHARAFTLGNDIYFNQNQYQPNKTEGKHLFAHELTHVAQQEKSRGNSVKNKLSDQWHVNRIQRKPEPKPKGLSADSGVNAILIAKVTVLKNDTAKSIMKRALIKFGLSKKKAEQFVNQLKIIPLSKLKPGELFPVFLTEEMVKKLGRKTGSSSKSDMGKGEKGKKKGAAAKKEGKESGTGSNTASGGGLGLIKVPQWVITTLKVADVILTIAALATGVGAIAAVFKTLAKQLIKRAVKRAVKEAAEKAAERLAKEALKKATRKGMKEAAEETTKKAIKKEIRESAEKAAKEALSKSMKKATKKEVDKAAKELAEEVAEKIAKKASKEAVKKVIRNPSMQGRIIGWGTGQSAKAVNQTIQLTQNLTKKKVKQMIKEGLSKKFVKENLKQYKSAINKGGKKLVNKQLLHRKELMERILKLWPKLK